MLVKLVRSGGPDAGDPVFINPAHVLVIWGHAEWVVVRLLGGLSVEVTGSVDDVARRLNRPRN